MKKLFSAFASRVLALVCTLMGGLGQGILAPRMPELLGRAEHMALDSGLSATLMYLGIFASTFGFGKAADRGRVHTLLSAGLGSYALILLLLAHAPSLNLILLLRGLEGLALSAIFVSADFLLGRLSDTRERGTWLSLYGVALSMGLLLGPALSLGLPYPIPFYMVSALAVLLGALTLAAIRVPASSEPQSLSKPKFNLGPLSAGATYGFLEATLVAVLPVIAVRELGIKPEWGLIVIILSAAISSVPWGLLSSRFGNSAIVRALLLILAIAPALLFFEYRLGQLPVAWLGFSACIVFGLLAGGLYPIGFSWLLEGTSEAEYGAAAGAFTRAYGLGALIGPFLCGLLVERWDFGGLLGLLAALGTITLLGMRRLLKPLS